MKVPEILKIGGLYNYAQRDVEDLTHEVPPVNDTDRKVTRWALDYYALIPEMTRDITLVFAGINVLNMDNGLERALFTGGYISCYIVGSYLGKYVVDKGHREIKKLREEIVEERWEKIRQRSR